MRIAMSGPRATNPRRQTTIKDVAREAEVSIATVSRVVNGSEYVSPEVEARVLSAIQRIGYYPDSVARSMKNNTTLTIGFLVSDISNEYFMMMARAVEEVVNKRSYHIIMGSTDGSKEREIEYLRTLLSKRIDGLIIDTTGHNYEFIARISHGMPMVVVHRRILDASFRGDFVGSNNRQGAYDLTKYFIANLHRDIAVVNGPLFISSGQERFEGFQRALREAGIPLRDEYRFDGDYLEHSGLEAAARFCALDSPPTALIVMNNEMMVGALKYLRSRGVRVPQDISVASFGDIVNRDLFYFSPPYITQDPYEIATRAANLILERIVTPGLPNREVILEPALAEADGIAPPHRKRFLDRAERLTHT